METLTQNETTTQFEQPHPRSPQFSILHAAAITGDKSTLSKLCAGKICDVDLRSITQENIQYAVDLNLYHARPYPQGQVRADAADVRGAGGLPRVRGGAAEARRAAAAAGPVGPDRHALGRPPRQRQLPQDHLRQEQAGLSPYILDNLDNEQYPTSTKTFSSHFYLTSCR